MESSVTVLLVVLGSRGKLRSKSLENLANILMNCEFVDPVQIGQEDRNSNIANERLSELLLGRRLSNSELGCAVTHKKAIAAAATALKNTDEIKWALFVEDDADLDYETFVKIGYELEAFDPMFPSLVTYYSARVCRGDAKVRARNLRKPMKASQHWSSGAVCYAVNRDGLKEILPFASMHVDYVADWPIYFSRLKRFVSNQIWVCEVGGPSSIGKRFDLKISERVVMHIRQLGKLREVSKLYELSVLTVIRHLILTPLFRDFSGRLMVLRSDTSKTMRDI
jgi:GR25 family glycosyltransferase involved in LPS biosynthesis